MTRVTGDRSTVFFFFFWDHGRVVEIYGIHMEIDMEIDGIDISIYMYIIDDT